MGFLSFLTGAQADDPIRQDGEDFMGILVELTEGSDETPPDMSPESFGALPEIEALFVDQADKKPEQTVSNTTTVFANLIPVPSEGMSEPATLPVETATPQSPVSDIPKTDMSPPAGDMIYAQTKPLDKPIGLSSLALAPGFVPVIGPSVAPINAGGDGKIFKTPPDVDKMIASFPNQGAVTDSETVHSTEDVAQRPSPPVTIAEPRPGRGPDKLMIATRPDISGLILEKNTTTPIPTVDSVDQIAEGVVLGASTKSEAASIAKHANVSDTAPLNPRVIPAVDSDTQQDITPSNKDPISPQIKQDSREIQDSLPKAATSFVSAYSGPVVVKDIPMPAQSAATETVTQIRPEREAIAEPRLLSADEPAPSGASPPLITKAPEQSTIVPLTQDITPKGVSGVTNAPLQDQNLHSKQPEQVVPLPNVLTEGVSIASQPEQVSAPMSATHSFETVASQPLMTDPVESLEITPPSSLEPRSLEVTRQSDTTPIRQDHGPRAIQQIAAALTTNTEGRIELRLDPEELGLVRVGLTPGDGAMTVHVSAERSETLDLLRRHSDVLARELRDIGYGDVTFDFGSGERSNNPPQRAQTHEISSQPLEENQATPEPTQTIAPKSSALSGGLDLRL